MHPTPPQVIFTTLTGSIVHTMSTTKTPNNKVHYHADVILSRLRDTMYHAYVILLFRTFLDTERNIWQRSSLQNFNNLYIFLTTFQFWPCPGEKKCHFTPLKSPLPQKISKYHADVILSRLRDTLDIKNNLEKFPKIQAGQIMSA